MTIDRIIFLRICEDRGIEAYGRLQGSANGGDIYARLRQLFWRGRRALQLRPLPLRRREGPRRLRRPAHARPRHRRQGAQGHPQAPLLPGEPLRVLRPAGRHPRPGLRAVPRQGHPPHRRAPRRGRGQARGQEGRRRLLHADLHRRLHRREHGRQAARGQDAQAGGRAAHPRPGLRLRLVPDRRLPVPARLAPRLVRGARAGEAPQGALPGTGRRVAAHHAPRRSASC